MLLRHHGPKSPLAKAIGNDLKGKISVVIYLIAVPLAFYYPVASYGLFFLVAAVWLAPDRRIERVVGQN
jgi:hypothetical protein